MDATATTQDSVTLTNGDGVVISDDNVMKQCLVSDFATYVSGNMPSTFISGQTAETSIADDDLILISDTSASGALRKMTRSNFVSGISGSGATEIDGLSDATTTTDSISLGHNASGLTGQHNVFVGITAGANVNSGAKNTAVGEGAGSSVTTGADNTLIGQNSGKQISVSGTLGAVGNSQSEFTLEAGSGATAKSSIEDFYVNYTITFTSGDNNGESRTITAYTSSRVVTVNSNFTATPAASTTYTLTKGASLTTGSQNTLLGSDSTCSATANNQTSLGYQATCTAANQITIGNPSVTALRCAETTIASVSDVRDKTDVIDSVYGLDFVDSLRPVQFTWKKRNIIPGDAESVLNGKSRLGFIAQEIQSAMPNNENEILDLVYDVIPERLEAKYGNLIPVLTQAIKDLKAQNDALAARVASLESA